MLFGLAAALGRCAGRRHSAPLAAGGARLGGVIARRGGDGNRARPGQRWGDDGLAGRAELVGGWRPLAGRTAVLQQAGLSLDDRRRGQMGAQRARPICRCGGRGEPSRGPAKLCQLHAHASPVVCTGAGRFLRVASGRTARRLPGAGMQPGAQPRRGRAAEPVAFRLPRPTFTASRRTGWSACDWRARCWASSRCPPSTGRPASWIGPAGPLATILLALSPRHLWVSRTSEPWIAAAASLAGAGRDYAPSLSLDRRWWWAAGLAFGLLLLDAYSLPGAALAWMAAAAAIGVWSLAAAPAGRTLLPARLLNVAAFLAAATVASLPGLAAARLQPTPADPVAMTGLYTALTGLLHSGGAAWDYLLDHPLLAAWPAALAALGMGRITRSLAQPHAALIAGWRRLSSPSPATTRWRIRRHDGPALAALPVPSRRRGPDTLLDVFMRVWRPLIPAHVATGAALALVLAAGSWQAYNATQGLQTAASPRAFRRRRHGTFRRRLPCRPATRPAYRVKRTPL